MRSNVGGWDRNMRWILGAGALVAGVVAPLPKGWRIGLIGFAAGELITAAAEYCPLNQALGINTSPDRIKKATKAAARLVQAATA